MSRVVAVLALVVCLCAPVRAEPITLPRPVPAEVYVKGDSKATRVTGALIDYDEHTCTIRVGEENQKLAWRDLTPASAFALRQKVIDRTSAADWLALGKFGWSLGVKDQAQNALKTAVRMDASLKAQADEVQASKLGKDRAEAEAEPAPPGAAVPPEAQSEPAPLPQPVKKKGEKVERLKYVAATPEESAAALKNARESGQKVQQEMGLKFAEIETDHFLIFTDWDPREHAFLKKNLEDAYRVVSRQFDMSPKDNIFVGKLPVYMFAKLRDFQKFARKYDEFPLPPDSRVAGYYRGNDQGMGHMVMWKPDESLTGGGNAVTPERMWGYVLVHEFTHAFVARYRSNEFIPRWLNEGIAEVIASGEIQLPDRRRMARDAAVQNMDVKFLFDDANMPEGKHYPVMQSMVELLVKTDRKGFIKLVDAIKDGTEPEEALKTIYKTDYEGLIRAWREYAKKLN